MYRQAGLRGEGIRVRGSGFFPRVNTPSTRRPHPGFNALERDLGGRGYEFVRFESADTTARYRNFKLHNRLTLVARDDQGQIQRWRWLRSVAERRGRFKIYSTED